MQVNTRVLDKQAKNEIIIGHDILKVLFGPIQERKMLKPASCELLLEALKLF